MGPGRTQKCFLTQSKSSLVNWFAMNILDQVCGEDLKCAQKGNHKHNYIPHWAGLFLGTESKCLLQLQRMRFGPSRGTLTFISRTKLHTMPRAEIPARLWSPRAPEVALLTSLTLGGDPGWNQTSTRNLIQHWVTPMSFLIPSSSPGDLLWGTS